MKKRYLVLIIAVVALFTACGGSGNGSLNNKSSRTVNDLMDGYVRAYVKTDVEAANTIFPDYYYARYGELTKEKLQNSLDNAKSRFGDDFNITYEITNTIKMTDEELSNQNEYIKNYFETASEATECYKYEGTITFKGSNSEDTDPISTMVYCKYNGEWYLTQYYG